MKILVTGATGRIGRQVVAQLNAMGGEVRALSRNPATADLPDGVEVVGGNLGQPETLGKALSGIDAVHLINFDAGTGGHLAQPEALVARLVQAGVQKVISFRGEAAGALEAALGRAPLAWTDLFIPVEFMANLREWAPSVRSDRTVRSFGPSLSAMIHEQDVAAVATRCLLQSGHAGRTYTLTGPEALTPADKVRVLAEELGFAVAHEEMSADEVTDRWWSLGYPEDFVSFLLGWYSDAPASAYTVLSTVSDVTGHPPRTFRDWVREHKAEFLPVTGAQQPQHLRYTIDGPNRWMTWSGTSLADVLNEDEDRWAKLGAVGFSRAGAGAESPFCFAYDEVLVVTKGQCSVESNGMRQTAKAGEVLYLRSGVPGTFRADEEVELVYVASSPYGSVNREVKAGLLEEAST